MNGNGKLGIDTTALGSTARGFSSVSSDVRTIYNHMKSIIEQVTGNDQWHSEASEAFLAKFNSIAPKFERDLQSLEDLGPAVEAAAHAYESAESENIGMM